MKYTIKIVKGEEGYAVWCEDLPGCASQGTSEEVAISNIKDAITEYLEVKEEMEATEKTMLIDVLLSGINHLQAIKAFEKAGLIIIRQGKYVIMSGGEHILTIPRANPINAYTMASNI